MRLVGQERGRICALEAKRAHFSLLHDDALALLLLRQLGSVSVSQVLDPLVALLFQEVVLVDLSVVDLLEPLLLVLEPKVAIREIILRLELSIVLVLHGVVDHRLLPLGMSKVLLSFIYLLRLKTSLNVVFFFHELLSVHQIFVLELLLQLRVEDGGLVQLLLPLVLLGLQLFALGLCDLLLFQLLLQLLPLHLLHVDTVVHLGQLVSRVLARVPRLIQHVREALLHSEATGA